MSDGEGKITWFEVPATDSARARGFYSLLFGWTFPPPDETSGEYHMTRDGGGAVYGDAEAKGITVYFRTADIDGAVAKVQDLGGQAGAVETMSGIGRYALCVDTEGNRFGLFQSS